MRWGSYEDAGPGSDEGSDELFTPGGRSISSTSVVARRRVPRVTLTSATLVALLLAALNFGGGYLLGQRSVPTAASAPPLATGGGPDDRAGNIRPTPASTAATAAPVPSLRIRPPPNAERVPHARDVAQGAMCNPNVWLGPRSDPDACMNEVMPRLECSNTFFNFALNGDLNCGCVMAESPEIDCTNAFNQVPGPNTHIYHMLDVPAAVVGSVRSQPTTTSNPTARVTFPPAGSLFKPTVRPIQMKAPCGNLEASYMARNENLFIITKSSNQNIVVYDVVNGHVTAYWRDCEGVSGGSCPRAELAWTEKHMAFGMRVQDDRFELACCEAVIIQFARVGLKWVAEVSIGNERFVLLFIHLVMGGWDISTMGLKFVEMHGSVKGNPICKKLDTNMAFVGDC